MKRLTLVLFLLLFSSLIHAATVDDAASLADRGNYTKAIEILRPLAASGDFMLIGKSDTGFASNG